MYSLCVQLMCMAYVWLEQKCKMKLFFLHSAKQRFRLRRESSYLEWICSDHLKRNHERSSKSELQMHIHSKNRHTSNSALLAWVSRFGKLWLRVWICQTPNNISKHTHTHPARLIISISEANNLEERGKLKKYPISLVFGGLQLFCFG